MKRHASTSGVFKRCFREGETIVSRNLDVEHWTRESYFAVADLLGPKHLDKRIQGQQLDWSVEPSAGAERFLEFLRGYDARTLLDVGCGYGRDAVFFAKHGFDVTGVEYSAVGSDTARGLYLSERARSASAACKGKDSWGEFGIVRADFREWECRPRSFDAVSSSKTLHQFRHNPPRGAEDPLSSKAFVKRMISCVSSGGLIGISTFSTEDCNYGRGYYIEEDTFDTRFFRPCAFYAESRFASLFTDCELIHGPEHLSLEEDHAPDGGHTRRVWFGVATRQLGPAQGHGGSV